MVLFDNFSTVNIFSAVSERFSLKHQSDKFDGQIGSAEYPSMFIKCMKVNQIKSDKYLSN